MNSIEFLGDNVCVYNGVSSKNSDISSPKSHKINMKFAFSDAKVFTYPNAEFNFEFNK